MLNNINNKKNPEKLLNEIIKNDVSVHSIKPIIIKKPIVKNQNRGFAKKVETSFIHEIKCDDVDELKKRRSNIIIIRQYLNSFDEQLKKIYGKDKDLFFKKLLKLNNEQLLCLLESIRVELNIRRNGTIFENIIETSALTFEQILNKLFNIDVTGTFDEMKQSDPEFVIELKMLACEIDFSQYVSIKKIIFLKLLKKYYMNYTINKSLKNININVDNEKLKELNDKFKNI